MLRAGELVALSPKTFDILCALIDNRSRVLEKKELLQLVWPDTFVEEGNLLVHISNLRKALGETASEPKYVQTFPKRGYRFIAVLENADTTATTSDAVPTSPSEAAASAPAHLPRSLWLPTAAVVVLLIIAVLAAALWVARRPPTRPADGETSLAILPFTVINSEGVDYLGVGLCDALITKIGKVQRIAVRPTSSVLKYQSKAQDPLAAGRELQVETVLDGKVQIHDNRLRLTVQMLNVADGTSLWAETFDEDFTNFFAVQDSISQKVARALAIELNNHELAQLAKPYTENNEAYVAYLKGRYFWSKRTSAAFTKAIESFEEAVRLDPKYALGYAGLADSYGLLARNYLGKEKADLTRKAKTAATQALALDAELAETHTSMAFVYVLEREWAAGEAAFQRALQLNPNYATAHHWYGLTLLFRGESAESIAHLKQALTLDPFSIIMNYNLAQAFYYGRQYDEAIAQFQKTRELDLAGDYTVLIRAAVALAQVEARRCPEALQELEREPERESQSFSAARIYVYANCGKTKIARASAQEYQQAYRNQMIPSVTRAYTYLALGEREWALSQLEGACGENDTNANWLKVDPKFDSLRAEPRFISLLRQLQLE